MALKCLHNFPTRTLHQPVHVAHHPGYAESSELHRAQSFSKPARRLRVHASSQPTNGADTESMLSSFSSADSIEALWEESIRVACTDVVTSHSMTSTSSPSQPTTGTNAATELLSWRFNVNAEEPINKLEDWWNNFRGWLLYEYYNWRQDTLNDLLIITGVNMGIILGGAFIQNHFIRGGPDAWYDLYNVATIILGQNFPDTDNPVAEQVFALVLGLAGLAGFALALAVAEQVVLEMLQTNVQKGSPVHECGHIVILGWCKSQRDLEVVWKIVEQTCYAYRVEGGTTVVVMTERGKLDMEAFFRRVLPVSRRLNSKLVFRQGSPMMIDDLHMVRAADAKSVVIVSDQSLPPDDADSQSMHSAILLDEMMTLGGQYRRQYKQRQVKVTDTDGWCGHNIITVEVLTLNALPLLRFATSARVIPVPAVRFNAMRMARVLHSPITILVTNRISSYLSRSQTHIHEFPALVGRTLGEVRFMFPDGLLLGIQNSSKGELSPVPPASYVIQPGDELIILRPGAICHKDYKPLPAPVEASLGDWTPNPNRPVIVTFPDGVRVTTCNTRAKVQVDDSASDLKLLVNAGTSEPLTSCGEGSMAAITRAQLNRPQRVLLFGWGEEWFMVQLLRELDKTMGGLPPGSEVTCVNQHTRGCTVGYISRHLKVKHATLKHVQADPLRQLQLTAAKIDMSNVTAVIIVSEKAWRCGNAGLPSGEPASLHGPAGDPENREVLRLDSLVLMVHLNIRKLMSDQGVRDVNIITEKVGSEVLTRFEDMQRLPLGSTVNQNAFSANTLSQVMVDPRKMLPFTFLPHNTHTHVLDADHYTALGERVSFYTLMKRAESLDHALLGFVIMPTGIAEEMQIMLNPEGQLERALPRVWNDGSQRLKFVSMAKRQAMSGGARAMGRARAWEAGNGNGAGAVEKTQV